MPSKSKEKAKKECALINEYNKWKGMLTSAMKDNIGKNKKLIPINIYLVESDWINKWEKHIRNNKNGKMFKEP